jgi:hypothetical protein
MKKTSALLLGEVTVKALFCFRSPDHDNLFPFVQHISRIWIDLHILSGTDGDHAAAGFFPDFALQQGLAG